MVQAEKMPDRRENLTLPEKLCRSINTNNQLKNNRPLFQIDSLTPRYDRKLIQFNTSITIHVARLPTEDETSVLAAPALFWWI